MKVNKARPRPDEQEETVERPKDESRSPAGKQRSGHRPGDREDSLPCHIDPQKPAAAR